MKNVYLVVNCENSPGRVLAVFASEYDAVMFAHDYLELEDEECEVVERTLFYGQPGHLGYNK